MVEIMIENTSEIIKYFVGNIYDEEIYFSSACVEESQNFSTHDKQMSRGHNLPFVLYHLKTKNFLCYDPKKERVVDISKKFVYENDLINKFDLCISVETLEHIQKKYSENFIESLCNLSDNILFSAAFIGQGGVNHVNENLHSNWAKIFKQYGYSPFDIFRPSIWNNEKISYWYRQNCFLYVKKNSPNYEYLSKKFSVIENYSFMDCVHPAMYEKKINKPIREILKDLLIKVKKKFFS